MNSNDFIGLNKTCEEPNYKRLYCLFECLIALPKLSIMSNSLHL